MNENVEVFNNAQLHGETDKHRISTLPRDLLLELSNVEVFNNAQLRGGTGKHRISTLSRDLLLELPNF